MKIKLLSFIFALIVSVVQVVLSQSAQFQIPITVTNSSAVQELLIGVSGDGPNPPGTILDNTIGVDDDAAYGIYREAMLPPLPPTYSFAARLMTIPGRVSTYPTGLGTGVYKDFRGYFESTQIDSFKIVISGDNTDVFPTTVTWPNNLNLYGTSWTIKPQTGTQWPATNMLTSTSVVIPEGATKNIIIIKIGALDPGVSVPNQDSELPDNYKLHQNYPNPFNPTTSIKFSVHKKSDIRLSIYDMLGREVRTFFVSKAEPGTKTIEWDGKDNSGRIMSSGIYLCRMTADKFVESRKMILLK